MAANVCKWLRILIDGCRFRRQSWRNQTFTTPPHLSGSCMNSTGSDNNKTKATIKSDLSGSWQPNWVMQQQNQGDNQNCGLAWQRHQGNNSQHRSDTVLWWTHCMRHCNDSNSVCPRIERQAPNRGRTRATLQRQAYPGHAATKCTLRKASAQGTC